MGVLARLVTRTLALLACAASMACCASPGAGTYGEVLGLSLDFYDAQRSGKLPADNKIRWRGDSLLLDRTPTGSDITGGWYDAGDNVKFQLPAAWTASMLGWGLIQFSDGYAKAGLLGRGLAVFRWGTDFFIKSYFAHERLVGQVGNGAVDHSSWMRPEDVRGSSVVYVLDPTKPGSDVAGSMAAALAQASMLFRQRDPPYAAKCLDYAKRIYEFGSKHQGKYSDAIADAAAFYPSSSFTDDLAWGAVWLYRATGQRHYLAQSRAFLANTTTPWFNIDWDNQYWSTALVLARQGAKEFADLPGRFAEAWLKGVHGVRFSPKGLAWHGEWGALRRTANAAFYLASHAKDQRDPAARRSLRCFAEAQLNYMLGQRTGQSFVVGFGPNYPKQPHHRAGSCFEQFCGWAAFDSPAPNPHIVAGALVGGPDVQDRYQDRRNNYIQNEVAIDYNAGFTGLLAALASGQLGKC